MANGRLAIPSKHTALNIIGPRDSFLAPRVQRLEVNRDVPTEDIDELGNRNHVGSVKDIPTVNITFSAMDVGIKIFAALTGVDPDAYPPTGVGVDELGEVDCLVYVRDDVVNKYVRTSHAKRMQIQDFNFNYSVDGNSTEDYTLTGSLERSFINDVLVEKFTTPGTGFTLSQLPLTLRNGDELITVRADGAYLEEVPSAPEEGEYSISGTTLTLGEAITDQVMVVYQVPADSLDWSDVNEPLMPAAIRGRDVPIYITANFIPGVQSVSLTGNMNAQPINEMGNRARVGYQRQVPEVTGTLTVMEKNNQLISFFSTGSLIPPSGETEFQPSVDDPGDIELQIRMIDPADNDAARVLKTVVVPKLVLQGDSFTQNVNENAQRQWNFRSSTGQVIVYSGLPA